MQSMDDDLFLMAVVHLGILIEGSMKLLVSGLIAAVACYSVTTAKPLSGSRPNVSSRTDFQDFATIQGYQSGINPAAETNDSALCFWCRLCGSW